MSVFRFFGFSVFRFFGFSVFRFFGFHNQATYIIFANPKERLLWLLAFGGIRRGNFFVEIYRTDQ